MGVQSENSHALKQSNGFRWWGCVVSGTCETIKFDLGSVERFHKFEGLLDDISLHCGL